MRLVEFLIFLLEAQAQTLTRLAALFGEDRLIEVLESDRPEETEPAPARPINLSWFQSSPKNGGSYSPYAELESAVHDFGLPAMLEFHLWAYPHYRAFIESPLDLNSSIPTPSDAGIALVEEAVAQAQAWIRALPIPPDAGKRAESASHVAWLRFRTNVLRRIGKRPMGPVY